LQGVLSYAPRVPVQLLAVERRRLDRVRRLPRAFVQHAGLLATRLRLEITSSKARWSVTQMRRA
jgi:hypothetical protein